MAAALTIAFSSILVKLADVTPATSAIFRCVYALPPLIVLAWLEDRRFGARPWRGRGLLVIAGLCFGGDLILWHSAIADVGAGLATVLGNLQVVVVPLAAWALLSERPPRGILISLPLVCSGIVLISGALETGAYGDHPVRGVIFGALTGVLYAASLLALRQASTDSRRIAGPLLDITAIAAVTCIVVGLALGSADLVPAWPSHAWLVLLALSSQVVGWLLITLSLPRLPAALTSVTLTIQPVCSVLLGVILLNEEPSALQLAGVVCIVGGLLSVARSRTPVAA